MSLYYFHLRNGVDTLLDEEGREIAEPGSIPEVALIEARSLISAEALEGCIHLEERIDVEDGSGNVIRSIRFADALAISQPKHAS